MNVQAIQLMPKWRFPITENRRPVVSLPNGRPEHGAKLVQALLVDKDYHVLLRLRVNEAKVGVVNATDAGIAALNRVWPYLDRFHHQSPGGCVAVPTVAEGEGQCTLPGGLSHD